MKKEIGISVLLFVLCAVAFWPGLRHRLKVIRMSCWNFPDESQRDSGSKPRVARNELPWENALRINNPNGVASSPSQDATTPLGLKTIPTQTQGSSCLATLGWETQSRWDCRSARSSRASLLIAGCCISKKAFGFYPCLSVSIRG